MRMHLNRKERAEMERFMKNLCAAEYYDEDEKDELRMAA